jgi:hypothetical protein
MLYPMANSADHMNFMENAVTDTDFGSANTSRVTCLAVLPSSALELVLYLLCHGNSCIGDHQCLITENIYGYISKITRLDKLGNLITEKQLPKYCHVLE